MSAEGACPANFPISSLQVSVCRSSGMFSEPKSTFGKNTSNPILPLVYGLAGMSYFSGVRLFFYYRWRHTPNNNYNNNGQQREIPKCYEWSHVRTYKRHNVRRHPVQDTDAPRKSEVIIIMETAARETHAA